MKLFVLLVTCFIASEAKKNIFPSFIKPCKITETVSACILENIEICKPYLAKGIPKLGIPSLSPFKISELQIKNNDLDITLKDLSLYEMDKFTVNDFHVDIKNHVINMDLTFPTLKINFNYGIKGKILILQLNGQGAGAIEILEVKSVVKMNGKAYQRDGNEYAKYDDIKVTYNVKNGTANFENIFGARQDLTDNTNKLINENFIDFLMEIKPLTEDAIAQFLKELANNLFGKISLAELFPN